MSAAVNDRPHPDFSTHLPLTGDLHPLRREFERWLFTGNAIAITTAMLAFATVYFWPRTPDVLFPTVQGPPEYDFKDYIMTPDDPSDGPVVDYDVSKDIPDYFIPELVPDLPEKEEDPFTGVGSNVPGESVPGEGFDRIPEDGDFVVDPPAKSPDFDWWTEAPVLLSIELPVYPKMVRDAGIDGDVYVRVLIGVNGKVKDAYVVEGSSALREAALVSARTAIFQPAKQGSHVVEVWVVIPIKFELSGHD